MAKTYQRFAFAAAIGFAATLFHTDAAGQLLHGRSSIGKSGGVSRLSGATSRSGSSRAFSGSRSGSSIGRGIASGRSSFSRGSGSSSRNPELFGSRGNGSNDFRSAIRDGLFSNRDYDYDGFRGLFDDHYDHHDDYADAYRDVGIANAVVSLFGIILSQGQRDYYAPAYAVEPAPRGHYVREKVVVHESYYQQEKVWVPPLYDRHTGQQVGGGYHETHTRLVPEEVEYREVWVED